MTTGGEAAAGTVAISLVLPDGRRVPVDGPLILGREPEQSPQVQTGSARGVPVDDETRAVSRAHARVTLEGGRVLVTDLASANGTFVAPPGEDTWSRVNPQETVELAVSGRLRLAAQELQCEAEQPPAAAEPVTEAAGQPQDVPVEAAEGSHPTLAGVADYVFVRPLRDSERGKYFLARAPERLGLEAENVVVKVVQGQTSDDAFRRATRELRAFAAADSPYLIKVHDAGQHGGVLFYSMDYIAGGSLAAPAQPLDTARIMRSVAQAARAAHALHEVGVVHQGIAPKRILIDEERAYLAELDVAQLMSPESYATSIGDLTGVDFLDPRLLTGERGSRASDIWSLGATLHMVLSGTSVYGPLPDDPLLAIRVVLTHQPQVNASLPADVAALIARAINPDTSERPATALEFAKELEALV